MSNNKSNLHFTWCLKTEFLEIGTFWLKIIGLCMSRREIKIDVWKYIRLVFGLLYCHTAGDSITSETHTSGAQ